jgi:hypothetical protein
MHFVAALAEAVSRHPLRAARSFELVDHRLRRFEIGRLESFIEPIKNRREKGTPLPFDLGRTRAEPG